MPDAYRYAVYAAPLSESAWWRAGSVWLGRDAAATGDPATAQVHVPAVQAELLRQLTAAPRRYGWHATVRAPFELASGVSLQSVRDALRTLCARHAPFDLPRLDVEHAKGNFLALVPAAPCTAVEALARECVESMQPLAAPLSPSERSRRRAGGLSPAQDALLLRWGYPYVMDQYRFHISLTGDLNAVPSSMIDSLAEAAAAHFARLASWRMETLALFAEPVPGADFVLLEHFALGAP